MPLPGNTPFVARRTFITVCLAAALSLAGCGGGSNKDNGSSASQTRQVVEQTTGPFRIIASVPKQTYRKGEAVPITFTVTNTSTEPLELNLELPFVSSSINEGGVVGQFAVNQTEKPIFDSLPESGGELSSVSIAAGETRTETFSWKQVDVGAYFPLTSPEDNDVFKNNTAAPGTYQIVPRLQVITYYGSQTVTFPNGTQEILPTERVRLNNGDIVTLPPLNITIKSFL